MLTLAPRILAIAALAGVAAPVVKGAFISIIQAQSAANVSAGFTTPPCGGGQTFSGDVFADPTQTVGSSSTTGSGAGGANGASSSSAAGYGLLRAQASSFGLDTFDPLTGAPQFAWAGATANFTDYLTFYRAGTVSGPLEVTLFFTLEGSASITANASGASRAFGQLGAALRDGSGNILASGSALIDSTSSSGPASFQLTFTLPDAISLRDAKLDVGLFAETQRNGSANFSSTAFLEKILLPTGVGVGSASAALQFDPAMGTARYALSPLSGGGGTTGGGTTGTTGSDPGAAVPEPSTLALLGVGGLAMVARKHLNAGAI